MDDDDDDGYDVLQDVSNKTKRKKDLFLFSFKRVFKQIFFEFIHSFFFFFEINLSLQRTIFLQKYDYPLLLLLYNEFDIYIF